MNNGDKVNQVASVLNQMIEDDLGDSNVGVSRRTITVSNLNGSTVNFERGNGEVRALIDIDGGNTTARSGGLELLNGEEKFHEILTSTYFEVIGPDGNVVSTSPVDPDDSGFQSVSAPATSTVLDDGSTTTDDPIGFYRFDTPGLYTVRVGSYQQSLGEFTTHTVDNSKTGVAAGLTYELNISVENHQFNADVLSVNNGQEKTIRIVDGTGKGAVSRIVNTYDDDGKFEGYDPEAELFQLADEFRDENGNQVTIDHTSVFEVTDAFTDPAPADSYEVVLTKRPTENVTVTIAPQDTKTYNSKLVFTDSNLPATNTLPQVVVANDQGNSSYNPVNGTNSGLVQLTFTPTNWNIPQTVTVTAFDDPIPDGQDAAVFPAFEERVARIRGPLEIEGGVRVSADPFLQNPLMLPTETNLPDADGTITAVGTSTDASGQPVATLTDTSAQHVDPAIGPGQPGMDPRMNDSQYEFLILTGAAAGTRMEVASVEGDVVTFTTDWPNGAPSAGDDYFFTPINANTRVDEAEQVDVVEVFNRESIANESATVSFDRLTGLGLGTDIILDQQVIPGGITYGNVEELNLHLGQGANEVVIESTHEGTTNVTTQDQNDTFDIKTVFGHTTIEAGDGNDSFEVGTDAGSVDQIASLLTIVGGAGENTVHIDDSGDTTSDSGTLNATTLRGLDMPRVSDLQLIEIRAVGGTFDLGTTGFGTDAGLQDSANVVRSADSAVVTIPYDADEAVVRSRLAELYDPGEELNLDITVLKLNDDYKIAIAGELAGVDLPELTWAEAPEASNLVAADSQSVDVRVFTLRDGTVTPERSTIQTLTLDANGGAFTLVVDGQEVQQLDPEGNQNGDTFIHHDVTAESLKLMLDPILNPNNSQPDKPNTNNVAVRRIGNLIQLEFRGEYRDYAIDEADIDAGALHGTLQLQTRMDGIDYFQVSDLDIDLGSGDDVFNVTATHIDSDTSIFTHDGADEFHVASTADGTFVAQDTATGRT